MPEGYPYGVQYDEQGRQFIWMPGGKKNYISPVAFGEKPPADTTGPFRSRPQWNQYKGKWETPSDWGNILTAAVASLMTAGASNALTAPAVGAANATSGAASGLLPNAWQVPTNLPWYMSGAAPLSTIAPTTAAAALTGKAVPGATGAPYIPGGESGVLPPALEAENAGNILPPPGVPDPLGSNVPKAPPNVPFTDKLKDFFTDPKTLTGLAGIIASLIAAKKLSNPGGGGGSGNEFMTPEMERYRALSEARFRRTDPLHEAISQLAFQRLPIQGREGISLPRVPLPPRG